MQVDNQGKISQCFIQGQDKLGLFSHEKEEKCSLHVSNQASKQPKKEMDASLGIE